MSALPPRVAVVGGGVTGSTAVAELSELLPGASITLFDQGRGLGGRASHRHVVGGKIVPPPPAAPEQEGSLRWDHGCQFFRADSEEFREGVLARWLAMGAAAQWCGRFGILPQPTAAPPPDFFGLPGDPRPVYVGAGGMHAVVAVPMQALEDRGAVTVRVGVRVGGLERLEGGAWRLRGVAGEAAFHDTAAAVSDKAGPADQGQALGDFDAVLLTDASQAAAGWHRASANLPAAFTEHAASRVRARPRVALFAVLVAFSSPIDLNLDAAAVDDPDLWFVGRAASKPGRGEGGGGGECWTLVSTPEYAVAEIERVPMRDPATGAFIPQHPSYLESDGGPAKALLAALERCLPAGASLPPVVHLSAQRWGSAMPAPTLAGGRDANGVSAATTVERTGGDRFDAARRLPLLPAAAAGAYGVDDFVDGGDLRLYYAGDFCSSRPPGVEAAALSAVHAARAIAAALGA